MNTTSAQPTPKLYYAETVNPRKACAVAKHVGADVEFVRVDLARGEHRTPEYLARNPNGKVPLLVVGDQNLWESSAIMAWLARKAESELWPSSAEDQVELLRWITWDATNFMPRAGAYYFEHYVKPRLGLGVPDDAKLAAAAPEFHRVASILEHHLSAHPFVVGKCLTVADFCLAATLPHAEEIHLPIAEYVNIRRWHDRLMSLPAWSNPWPS